MLGAIGTARADNASKEFIVVRFNRREVLSAAAVAAAASGAALPGSAPAQAQIGRAPHGGANGLAMTRGLTLATIRTANGSGLGVRTPHGVLDVAAAARGLKQALPLTVDDLLHGKGDMAALATLVRGVAAGDRLGRSFLIPEKAVRFGPVVTDPEKIVCVGLNYRAHIAETGAKMPTVPVLFNKFSSALNHHGGEIAVSRERDGKNFDYEAELVIVIGRVARDVSEQNALSCVAGYCTGQDFTARDLQSRTAQWMIGKAGDGWGPIGPWLVGADLVNPDNLKIEMLVNGETRQSANTADMVFNCAKIVSYTSGLMTLRPGDVIFTGTPSGIIGGYPPEKRIWLKAGDKLITRVEKLGDQEITLT